jgi:hypothetical protein
MGYTFTAARAMTAEQGILWVLLGLLALYLGLYIYFDRGE